MILARLHNINLQNSQNVDFTGCHIQICKPFHGPKSTLMDWLLTTYRQVFILFSKINSAQFPTKRYSCNLGSVWATNCEWGTSILNTNTIYFYITIPTTTHHSKDKRVSSGSLHQRLEVYMDGVFALRLEFF